MPLLLPSQSLQGSWTLPPTLLEFHHSGAAPSSRPAGKRPAGRPPHHLCHPLNSVTYKTTSQTHQPHHPPLANHIPQHQQFLEAQEPPIPMGKTDPLCHAIPPTPASPHEQPSSATSVKPIGTSAIHTSYQNRQNLHQLEEQTPWAQTHPTPDRRIDPIGTSKSHTPGKLDDALDLSTQTPTNLC